MNFEPQKFFIGLVGFFSVIMPGALLAYLGKDWIARQFLGRGTFPLEGAEMWLVFLFASYLLGHFAFLFGSTLDDLLYNPVREATYAGQLRRLARGDDLSPSVLRKAARSSWLFHREPDNALLLTQRLQNTALAPIGGIGSINTYQWSKVRLSKDHPEGLLAVERFEADSKFFRSFAVVLCFLLLVLLWQLRFGQAAVCAVLALPALWRYADQRFKATQQAYWFIITLEAERARNPAPTDGPVPGALATRADGLTHAGGVVFRNRGTSAEYLLVTAKSPEKEWVLPKGHIEPYEDPRETAVREVREESGVWANLLQPIDDADLLVGARSLLVRFYLMEAVEEGTAGGAAAGSAAEGRAQRWSTCEEAIALATHSETRTLLASGDRMRMVLAASRARAD